MNIVVRDIIESLEKSREQGDIKGSKLELDPYSYAALREELGLDFDEDLNFYHGIPIEVNENESEVIRFIH